MDTIENEAPVGEAGATASPDTASQDTQTAEVTEETVSDGDAETQAEEALLAGKYKSPQELEKAYKELESKLGETGQKAELVNLLEKNTGMTAQQIKDAIANQEKQRLNQEYQSNPQAYTLSKVQELEGKLALQAEERELDKFLQSEEGKAYESFRDKILNLGLKLETGKTYAEIAKEYFGESRAQGQKDAYKKIETKKNTQATGAMSQPKRKLTEEDMDNMTAAELEKVLPWADTSNRLY
jgi:hypothetical protein